MRPVPRYAAYPVTIASSVRLRTRLVSLGLIATAPALIVILYRRADALGLVADRTFEFPLSQQHIADALGLSLVHTNKTLARLRRMEMYTQANGALTLTNPHVLERVAQYFDRELPRRPLL